jgi:hypothetical protein
VRRKAAGRGSDLFDRRTAYQRFHDFIGELSEDARKAQKHWAIIENTF